MSADQYDVEPAGGPLAQPAVDVLPLVPAKKSRPAAEVAEPVQSVPALQPVPSPHKTPIQFLEDIGALALKPLLVHSVHVSEADILRMAANECAVVHCPRANLRLENGRMPMASGF